METDGDIIVIKEEAVDEESTLQQQSVDVDNEPSPPPMLPLHGLQSMFDTIDYLIVQDGYQCAACPEHCRRSFPDMPALRRHMVRHITEGKDQSGAKKEMRCNHCNRTFERIELLRKHLLEALRAEYGVGNSDTEDEEDDAESNQKPVIFIVKSGCMTCSACDAVFGPVTRWNKEKFKLHVGEVHWKPLPHKCDECGKRFYHEDKLERHVRRHEISQSVGWMGSETSASEPADVKKEQEQDPTEEPQDPMNVVIPEVQVKAEIDDDEPLEYVVEEAANSDSNSQSCSSESESLKGDRAKKRKKKVKAKPQIMKHPPARKVPIGEDGSIVLACSLCDEGFLLQEVLDRHMIQKHDTRERPFHCSECSKTYLSDGNLQEHIRMAHSGVKFTCKECGTKLATKNSLKRHMQRHTGEGYCCDICKEKFSSYMTLVRHKKRIHENLAKNFVCLECGRAFSDNASLREHRMTHTDVRRWECETCGTKFKRNQHLLAHQKMHLAEKIKKTPLPTFACQECDEKFTGKLALAAHRRVHGRFSCQICKLTFDTQIILRQHRKQDHNLQCRTCLEKFQTAEELLKHGEEAHANDAMLECDVCKATFPTPISLQIHKRSHGKVYLYDCPNCSEVFNSKLLMDRHLKDVHKDHKNYICDQCGKGFPTRSQITAHLDRHRNPGKRKPSGRLGCHICDICGKGFRYPVLLQRHVFNVHTNQNTFKCEHCDKVLSTLEKLKVHTRFHTNQDIKCEQCDRTFAEPYRLREHMKIHMRDGTIFRCHICNRSCSDSKKLEKHMQLHAGNTQYSCTICERHFSSNTHLKQHMQRTHQDVKCPQCDKVFPTQKKMSMHVKIHDFPDYFECPKCFTCIKDKKTLNSHMERHEGIRVPCQYCPMTFGTKKCKREHERRRHGDQLANNKEAAEGSVDDAVNDDDILMEVGGHGKDI